MSDASGTMASRTAGNPRGSGYRRVDRDWYVEPIGATHALLDHERFVGTIWDPACGGGNIIDACRSRGLDARGSDIVDRGFLHEGRRIPGRMVLDFLDPSVEHQPIDNIICNPPFALAEAFAEQALKLARFKVAFIQRLTFLEGQKRSKLLQSSPLARVYVFANRISMPPGGQGIEPKGGFMAYAWFVWQMDHEGPATIHWVNVESDARHDSADAPL